MTETQKAFKKYDIRGVADEDLNQEFMQRIGYGFAKHNNITQCMVGRDIRKTSNPYTKAFIRGLRAAGCDVTSIGVCSTAQLKWAVAEKQYEGAAMITASHNPPQYNGIKLYRTHGEPYGQDQGMHELQQYLSSNIPTQETGELTEIELDQEYATFLQQELPANDTPVFIDPSAGAACKELTTLLGQADYNWTLFNAKEDPYFKQHSPNPLDPEAQEVARDYSRIHQTISIVLDGDADRVQFIDETGTPVPPDYLAAWLAQHLVSTGAASTVNASRALKEYCAQNNKKYVQTPVGWIYIQNALTQEDLDLGVEKSGHVFFKTAHYAEAPLLCLLYVLKFLDGKRLADVIRPTAEKYHSSTEHNYTVEDRQHTLSKAKQEFTELGEVSEEDGILVEADNYWLSLRASNTEPLIRATWEAHDQETYSRLKERIQAFMNEHSA